MRLLVALAFFMIATGASAAPQYTDADVPGTYHQGIVNMCLNSAGQAIACGGSASPMSVQGVVGGQAQPVTPVGSQNLNAGAVSVGTTAGGTLVVPARTGNSGTGRRSVTLWNRTGTDPLSCGPNGIADGQGAFMAASIGSTITIDTQAAIYCKAPATAQNVSFIENW